MAAISCSPHDIFIQQVDRIVLTGGLGLVSIQCADEGRRVVGQFLSHNGFEFKGGLVIADLPRMDCARPKSESKAECALRKQAVQIGVLIELADASPTEGVFSASMTFSPHSRASKAIMLLLHPTISNEIRG